MVEIITMTSNHVEKLGNSFALKQINALTSISVSTKIYSDFLKVSFHSFYWSDTRNNHQPVLAI